MQRASPPHADRYDPIMAPILCSGISVQCPADSYIHDPDDYKNRRGIPALPFSKSQKTYPREKFIKSHNILKTIGDHIKKWRVDRGLRQKDVANKLGISVDTLANWEVRNTVPAIKQMPLIIQLLGYLPFEIDTSTLGGKIAFYRHIQGLSQRELAIEIGVNESTIFHYEKGTHCPQLHIFKKLKNLLQDPKLPSCVYQYVLGQQSDKEDF